MSRNRGSGNGVFFQRTVFLMSLFLVLLFTSYELLETPPKDFIAVKIIGFKREDDCFSIALFLKNNSSGKHEGHLIFLIGYEGSRVSEDNAFYCFTNFRTLGFRTVTLNPGEGVKLNVKLPMDPEAERIIIAYCWDASEAVQTGYYSPVLLRRDDTVWVQTWIG